MNPAVIALDLGTSGAKAVRYDGRLRPLAASLGPYRTREDGRGGSHLDPLEVWNGACAALRGLPPEPAGALVLSSQMYSALLLTPEGAPAGPALTWADVSSAAEAGDLRHSRHGSLLHDRCGCPPSAIYPLAKWKRWTRRVLWNPSLRVGDIKSFVIHHLTGSFCLDHSVASATGARNLRDGGWDAAALDWAGLPASALPPLVPVRHRLALSAEAAAATGLPSGLPVIVGGGDGPLASLGTGASRPGAAAINVGTSAAIHAALPRPETRPESGLWTYLIEEGHAVTGGILVGAGSLLDQLRRFCGGLGVADLEALPLSALPAPVCILRSPGPHDPDWDECPRFDLTGLRPGHTPADVAAALVHGIAAALAALLGRIETVTGPLDDIRTGGSVGRSSLWEKAAAEAFRRPLRPALREDPSARGAALIAWAALGAIADPYAPELHPAATTP